MHHHQAVIFSSVTPVSHSNIGSMGDGLVGVIHIHSTGVEGFSPIEGSCFRPRSGRILFVVNALQDIAPGCSSPDRRFGITGVVRWVGLAAYAAASPSSFNFLVAAAAAPPYPPLPTNHSLPVRMTSVLANQGQSWNPCQSS